VKTDKSVSFTDKSAGLADKSVGFSENRCGDFQAVFAGTWPFFCQK
jgi:hypothetical protein